MRMVGQLKAGRSTFNLEWRKLHYLNGNLISVSDWFIVNFPEQSMDGELWL